MPNKGWFYIWFSALKAVPNVKQVGPQLYMSQRYGPRSVGCPSLADPYDAERKHLRNGCIQRCIGSKDMPTLFFDSFPTNFKVIVSLWFSSSMYSAEQGSFLVMWFLMPESGTLRDIDWGIHLVSLESYKLASILEFEPSTLTKRCNASAKDATKLYSSMIN